MSNFFKLAQNIYKNRTDPNSIEKQFPMKIKKNENEFKVYLHIYINFENKYHDFNYKSSELDNKEGFWLTLFRTGKRFENIEKFDINKDDEYNIDVLSKYLEFAYNYIDELVFDISDACFISKEEYEFKKLAKEAFCDENKMFDFGLNECSVCFEKVNTKTICGHDICFHCILKVNKCPICRRRKNINFCKQLKDSKHYMEGYNNQESDEDDEED